MILNKDKLRPDVLRNEREHQRLLVEGIVEFLNKNKNSAIDFGKLWKRVMAANERFFKKEKTVEELTAELSMDEIQFLARALRYSFEYMSARKQEGNPILENVIMEEVKIDAIPAEWHIVPGAREDRVILYLHGGGYIMGSPGTHRLLTVSLGNATGMKVLSPDYRLSPEHNYPDFLEDAVSAYTWLLNQGIKPGKIIISGDSAGGHLALITLLKLKELGMPMPAGAVLISPLTIATFEEGSFISNAQTDPVLADAGVYWWIRTATKGYDFADPKISPGLADMSGLPPLCFQVSTTEMLYHDSVAAVKKARDDNVDAELQVWEDMTHVFQIYGPSLYPESGEAFEKCAEFAGRVIR